MAASFGSLAVAVRNYPSITNRVGRVLLCEFDPTLQQWVTQDTLEPGPGHGPFPLFYSWHLALHEDVLIVSAPGLGVPMGGGPADARGGFFAYEKDSSGWNLVEIWELPASVSVGYPLGASVATDGQTLLSQGFQSSVIFVLERSPLDGTWDLVQQIPNPFAIVDEDGIAMSVDGDTFMLGAEWNSGGAQGQVIEFVRVNGAWVQGATLESGDSPLAGDGFGASVDLQGDVLAVGAHSSGPNGGGGATAPGAAYLFRRSSTGIWERDEKLIKQTNLNGEVFGSSIALHADAEFVVVGDRLYTFSSDREGAAFAYDLPLGQVQCDGALNSTGEPARLEVLGSRKAQAGHVRLKAMGLPPGLAGVFLGSQSSGFQSNPAGSGNLCLGGAIARFSQAGQYGVASADGSYELSVDTQDIPFAPGVPILAGQTWHFQMWYRDLNPMPTTNLTSAVEVQFE